MLEMFDKKCNVLLRTCLQTDLAGLVLVDTDEALAVRSRVESGRLRLRGHLDLPGLLRLRKIISGADSRFSNRSRRMLKK